MNRMGSVIIVGLVATLASVGVLAGLRSTRAAADEQTSPPTHDRQALHTRVARDVLVTPNSATIRKARDSHRPIFLESWKPHEESDMEKTTGGIKTANGSFTAHAEDLGEQAMAQIDRLREQAGEVSERVVGFIKERPGTSLLIAAAAGYLIGRMLRS